LAVWLNFMHESTMQLLLWHPRCWEIHYVKSRTIWTFCELQIGLTRRWDEMMTSTRWSFKQSKAILCDLCVLEMWCINCGNPVVRNAWSYHLA
jgi:hypothetical protein